MTVRLAGLTSIAATAGVSVFTVSKVLNGRSDVVPRTRERVGRLLRQKDYQDVALPGVGVVDLLIGGLGSLWADELVCGTVTAAASCPMPGRRAGSASRPRSSTPSASSGMPGSAAWAGGEPVGAGG